MYCISCTYIINFLFAVPPLFVVEFLHRVMDLFDDYFTECTESNIKDNYVVVYEVRCYSMVNQKTRYNKPSEASRMYAKQKCEVFSTIQSTV